MNPIPFDNDLVRNVLLTDEVFSDVVLWWDCVVGVEPGESCLYVSHLAVLNSEDDVVDQALDVVENGSILNVGLRVWFPLYPELSST